MSRLYKRILRDADAHFRAAFARYREHFQCGVGCSFCCYGLFEIGAADVAVLADGLRKLDARRRKEILDRAARILEETGHPDIREIGSAEREAFFDRTASVPCPALQPDGSCGMYEWRPLVCRTFGLPLRDGESYIGDICDLNFQNAGDNVRQDAAWDLQNEDVVGVEDQYTIPEALLAAARLLQRRSR